MTTRLHGHFVANDGMQHSSSTTTATARLPSARSNPAAAAFRRWQAAFRHGTVFQDYDNDGKPDINRYRASPGNLRPLPQRWRRLVSNQSLEAGLGALTAAVPAGALGWKTWTRRWKDLFVAQGHVLTTSEAIDHSLHYLETPLLAMNHGGRFERAESGITIPVAGRGLAFGDLNNDGWMDAVMTVFRRASIVLMNRGGNHHWLTISLRGSRSNRDGLGARVRVNGQNTLRHYCGKLSLRE